MGSSQAAFRPEVAAQLARLPPKLVDIGGGGAPRAVVIGAATGGMGPRIQGVVDALGAATFTGKGDREVVVGLYREFVAAIGNAFVATGVGVAGEYVGERNAAGEREGRGRFTFADGESFERVFVNGKETEPMLRPGTCNGDCENGQGVYIYENGDRYDGGWANGLKEGAGVYTFRQAAGHYDGQWKKGVKHGSGTFHYGADGKEFYTGQWQGGKQDGAGLFRFASGGQYEGGWEHGREHGLGTYTFPDGEAFERTWVHGRETERMVQAKQQQQQQQLASGAAGLGLQTDL